jgi:DivIVA domain-containing protein
MSKRKRKREEEAAAAAAELAAPDATDATAALVEESASPRRLLPVDVQQKEFRLAFRGYNEQDVDVFLDGVTEELARLHEENKRLIEQLEEGGGVGPSAGALIADAQRRAEDIVREARAQAGALLAGGGAELVVEPPPGEDIRPFLVREREFLQGLASLIQQHAESVKREAQQVRGASSTEPSTEPSAEFSASSPASTAAYAVEATSEPSAEYVPRHASESAPPAPVPIAPELPEAAPPAIPESSDGGRDAWGPERQADAWAEAPEPEPAEASLPPVPAAVEVPGPSEVIEPAETAQVPDDDLGQTQSWSAPSTTEWDEAVELPLEDEAEPAFGSAVEPPSMPRQAVQEPAFGAEGGGEAPRSNPFLETGGRGPAPVAPPPADLEDDLRPDPISLSPPPPEAEPESPSAASEPPDAPRDESDEADREESDRSLRELFWGEE